MDRPRLQRAELALEQAIEGLQNDPAGETIGFETIVPTLLSEAKSLGIIQRQKVEVIKQLTPMRSAKLTSLPNGMINRFVTLAFSAEMAGPDGQELLDIDNLQESNGSVGHSPSATAYFVRYVSKRDPSALRYLQEVTVDGTAPNVSPFDVFEQAWVLWNLTLTNKLDEELLCLCHGYLDFLEKVWDNDKGVGFASGYTPNDSDVTSLVYDVLSRFRRSVNITAVLHYETPYYFRCYDLESTPSISANIHVLGALRQAGLSRENSSVQKVHQFLEEVKTDNAFWYDKWHASPYYATSQAIISSAGYDDELVNSAVDWIISTQKNDGSWGYYPLSTAEETAYCLQALKLWKKCGNFVPKHIISSGVNWLINHQNPPYPSLWIGKCLYCPELVIESAILSALIMSP